MKTNFCIKYLLPAALVYLFTLYAAAIQAASLYDPSLKWKTITSQNFYIHYHNGIEGLAAELSVIAEDVHKELSPLIRWQPADRTHVVMVDNTDSANGYSTPFPVNTVVLYVANPEVDSVLNNYTNWLRMIFTHEYTHTLNLDMINGFCAATRTCPGRFWFPSQYQPIWLIEGNAVYHESRAGMGRNNSAYTAMILRTELTSGQFASAGGSTAFPRRWPSGNIPYLYGGLFLEYLEKYHGKGSAADIFQENSDNIIPFRVNKNARDVYGKDFQTLWSEWHKYILDKYTAQAQEIASRGLTSFEAVSDAENNAICPRFAKDGKSIYYIETSQKASPYLMMFNPATGGSRRLCRVYSPLSLSAAADGSVYVSDAAVYKNFSQYTEAWRYTRGYKRLTKGLRGKYIDISGKETVYVSQSNGFYSLVIDNSTFSAPKVIVDKSSVQMAETRFSPDAGRIVFTVKERDALTSLMVYERNSGKFTRLTSGSSNNIGASWSPDGNKIIFSSDRSGVYNLYEYNLQNGETRRLTNLIGGAFAPDVSPDGSSIVFSSYGAHGHTVAVMKYSDESYGKEISHMSELDDDFFEQGAVPQAGPIIAGSTPYNPLTSVMPQLFFPMYVSKEIYHDKYDAALGISTYGWDALQRHSYSASALWFYAKQNRLVVDALYTCSIFYPDITIAYYDESIKTGKDKFPYGDDNKWTTTRELTRMGYLTISIPVATISSGHRINITGTYEKRDISIYLPALPQTIDTEIYLSRGRLMYGYSNTRTYAYSISPEHGRTMTLMAEAYNKDIASDSTFYRTAAQYNEYLSGLFANHVTALLLRGAAYVDKPDIIKPFSLGQHASGKQTPYSDIRDEWGLRGFHGDYGSRLLAASLEYRLPVIQKDFALGLFPMMFRDLWLSLFGDYGNVWYGSCGIKDFKVSAGLELHTRFTLGYNYEIEAFVGYAHGFNEYGEDKVYFGISTFLADKLNNSDKRLDYL